MLNPLDLSGSVIMVTGASSGIGRSTAQLLSQLGARIVLVSRTAEALDSTRQTLEGNNHLVSPFDLRNNDGLESWFGDIVKTSGPLHGLVHCAGTQLLRPVKLSSVAEIEDLFRINVTSGLMLAKAFRKKGHHAASASIVYLSSVMGEVGAPGRSAYCSAKAAVIGMVKALALELGRDGIRVNCIAPGFVATGMLKEMESALGLETFQEMKKMHPLGFGDPMDIANAAAFLLARASSWVTGTTLVVDGGYTAH